MSATIVSISLPSKLAAKLNKFCASEERSKSFLVKKALELFFDEMAKDIADHQIALKSYKEYKASGSKGISWEKIKKENNLK